MTTISMIKKSIITLENRYLLKEHCNMRNLYWNKSSKAISNVQRLAEILTNFIGCLQSAHAPRDKVWNFEFDLTSQLVNNVMMSNVFFP